MINFLYDYGLFLAKCVTIGIAFIIVITAIIAAGRGKRHADASGEDIIVHSLNTLYETRREQILAALLDKKAWKKRQKQQKKNAKKEENTEKPCLFVLDFEGDIDAEPVTELREYISAVIQVAKADDRVLLRLESGGGLVHAYGLAASQLSRLKEKNIALTVAVDKVAASGGYMMACVADELIAAPFAVLGSVGVIGALPNIHELLQRHHIRYEQHTAGAHKRSLTVLGENTEADRVQFKHELAVTHELFKAHIHHYRPQLDIEQIATGETWYGSQCLENKLIDKIMTSDDYILSCLDTHQVVVLSLDTEQKQSLLERLKHYLFGKMNLSRGPFKTSIH